MNLRSSLGGTIAAILLLGSAPFGPEIAAACDGFNVLVAGRTRGLDKVYFDNDGNPVRREVNVNFDAVLTHSGTGAVLGYNVDHVAFSIDLTAPPPGAITIRGRFAGLFDAEGRLIQVDVGRAVFDFATGQVLFEAGRHPALENGIDECTLFASQP